jgi:hypothetical protein
MNSAAARIPDRSEPGPASIDLAALREAPVTSAPFPYLIVPHFVCDEALEAIGQDFPAIAHPGSFPLSTLRYGPAFQRFMDEIQSPEMTACVAHKFGMDLSASPTMVTVRGQSREADGKIHTDSRSKLVTALIYMNDAWESQKGRLRLVRSPDNLDDVVAEVPPERGTLLMFVNTENAWHGFESFSGPRRVIQLNWVRDADVVRREQARHRMSAFFKRLFGRQQRDM